MLEKFTILKTKYKQHQEWANIMIFAEDKEKYFFLEIYDEASPYSNVNFEIKTDIKNFYTNSAVTYEVSKKFLHNNFVTVQLESNFKGSYFERDITVNKSLKIKQIDQNQQKQLIKEIETNLDNVLQSNIMQKHVEITKAGAKNDFTHADAETDALSEALDSAFEEQPKTEEKSKSFFGKIKEAISEKKKTKFHNMQEELAKKAETTFAEEPMEEVTTFKAIAKPSKTKNATLAKEIIEEAKVNEKSANSIASQVISSLKVLGYQKSQIDYAMKNIVLADTREKSIERAIVAIAQSPDVRTVKAETKDQNMSAQTSQIRLKKRAVAQASVTELQNERGLQNEQ
ncbi:hypothetical protein [Mycoplasmopsis agassizii]|uniref:Uncharacterized protein n=1 Tax=Mycoplasmopsis agassizii TaxID=33922 RepID=A0ABX4H681_9BACT|nr:hypothetical protein [Mycoplasmopsis agassizii]PAF55376.1 hypothetical protein CJF60_01650 [Mycoplasmopsis agassizii]SMC20339.1 hypothetical protein SAMN02745179_01015 [Mycoplasmopsis agassizii]